MPVVQHLQYDDGGALAEVEVTDRASTQTQVHGLRYNARGQRAQVEHGNGVTTTFTYDPDTFRLTRQVAERSDTSKLQDLRLTWGPAGQIYAIRDGIQTLVYYDNEITHPERQFVYDARGRLIRATGREHATTYGLDPASVPSAPCSIPGPASEVSGYIRDYEWDAAGNMTELSVVGGWTRSLTYDTGSNRLESFTWSASSTTNDVKYDQFGQMEGLPSAKDLRWDGDGNLRYSSPLTTGATTRTWYVYAGAQRVRKVTEEKDATDWHIAKETIYLDGGFEVYRTYDASGNLQLEREHVRITDGAGHALEIETVVVEGGSAVSTITPLYRYSLVDQIGSVCVELDQAATVVSYEEYHPFGTTAYYGDTRGAEAKRYRYSGKEQDAETGLYYYGYRYYAPAVARWTAPDPAGTVDGANLFAFVVGNPVVGRDLDGRQDASGWDPDDPNLPVLARDVAAIVAHGAATVAYQSSGAPYISPGARQAASPAKLEFAFEMYRHAAGTGDGLPVLFVGPSDVNENGDVSADTGAWVGESGILTGLDTDRDTLYDDILSVVRGPLAGSVTMRQELGRITVNLDVTRAGRDLALRFGGQWQFALNSRTSSGEHRPVRMVADAPVDIETLIETPAHEGSHRHMLVYSSESPFSLDRTVSHMIPWAYGLAAVETLLPALAPARRDDPRAVTALAERIWERGYHPRSTAEPRSLAVIAAWYEMDEQQAHDVFVDTFTTLLRLNRSGFDLPEAGKVVYNKWENSLHR